MLSLHVQQIQRLPAQVSPIMRLTPLELEQALTQSLEEVVKFHEANLSREKDESSEARNNYMYTSFFTKICKGVKGKVSASDHLEVPQIFIDESPDGFAATYNSELEKRIRQKLDEFKRQEAAASLNEIFSLRFENDWSWMRSTQQRIAEYACEIQEPYVFSKNPFDLNPLNVEDVAIRVEYSQSTVYSLLRNLSLQLPDDDQTIIFVADLIPANRLTSVRGKYALGQLQQDPDLYESGTWKVTDQELSRILKENFDLELARRTVNKYVNSFQQAS